jgi:transposase
MAPHLPQWKIDAIEHCIAENAHVDLNSLAEVFHTTYESIRYIRYRMLFQLSTGYDDRKKAGRPHAWTPEIEQFVLELLYRDNDLFQDEVANEIYDCFDVKLNQPQMSRMYKSLGITNKKLKYTATQQEQALIDQWANKMKAWKCSQLVYIDESASNEKTGERKYGWAPLGIPAKQKQWLKRSKRWSVLPAYTYEGYIKAITFQGGITQEIFED